MKRAVLLPNVTGFPSESMVRYANELSSSLRGLGETGWEFDRVECKPSPAVDKLLGAKMASRHARFISYPRMIRQLPIDNVFHILDHSHANLALTTPSARSAITCHDIIPLLAARKLLPMKAGLFTRWTFPLRIRCMQRCNRVITISQSTRRNLIEVGGIPGEKIRVVYYGVNPTFEPAGEHRESERAEILTRHGIPPASAVVLHVATATRYKNTPALLHAIKALCAIPALGEKVRLLRVGADFFEDEQQLITELGIGDRIHHAGRIFPDTQLARYYRAADVFAFPSLWEGFGWPPLEAMACGTPVVTSTVASLPEVVGDAGTCVAPADYAALTTALAEVLTNPSLKAERARLSIARAKQFTWERCARETLAVYEEIAASER